MTDDVRNDVAAELKLAEECLVAAEQLLRARLPAHAAGRIYYAAFHAARSLLFSIGVAPRSPEALRSMFALHFVKTGRMATGHSKALAELEGLRGAGDYDPTSPCWSRIFSPSSSGPGSSSRTPRGWFWGLADQHQVRSGDGRGKVPRGRPGARDDWQLLS